MEATKNNLTARDFQESVLKDDHREWGGTSFKGETLKNFMEEVRLTMNTPILKVAEALNECGIVPVAFPDEYKRRCYKNLVQALTRSDPKDTDDTEAYTKLHEAIGDVLAFFRNGEAEKFMQKHYDGEAGTEDARNAGLALQKAFCKEYDYLTSDIHIQA